MKKNVFLLLMTLLFFMATDAGEWFAEDSYSVSEPNFYAKIASGVNFLQNTSNNGNKSTFKAGYLIAGSLGYSWDQGVHLEMEYAFRRNAIKKIHFFLDDYSKSGHFQTSSCMVNLLWDLPVCAFWDTRPFIGAGLGYDFQQMHASNSRITFNQKWKHFSWQMMAGLSYPILCNTEVTLEYRFHQGGCKFHNHSLQMGLVYKFGYLPMMR